MAEPAKDTIYIDIDDEITGIIDKVRSSNGKIVALVLPKRAAVLQSIVNMKLLKRAAEDSKKHLVLITSEAGLLPLAGAAGVHVARTLTSKPEIPAEPSTQPTAAEDVEEVDAEELSDEITAENAGNKPVGELAGAGVATKDGDLETLELDNVDPSDETATAVPISKKPAVKKDKKLAVPNFERFRLLLILGGLALIALIIGGIFAAIVLPKATIAIDTDASAINVDEDIKLLTTAKSVRLKDNTLPAKLVQQQKTFTQQVATTGQKNNGNKAQGSVSLTAVSCGVAQQAADVPAGTGLSANGLTFITQENTTFSPKKISNGCITFQADDSTSITAQSGGSNYNVSNASFTVAGRRDVTGSGSASGGTDNIVQVVSQSDIANAKNKISASNDNTIKQALQNQLKGDNYYPITATYATGTPSTTNSAEVGDVANNVTVTQTVTYTMFGVQESDLRTIVEDSIKDQIDTEKQSILSLGLDKAVFNVNAANETSAELTMHATATAGPELDIERIKQEAAGKKSGQVKSALESSPDVTGVEIKLSPFWVSSVPKNTSKITVTIEKPEPVKNNADSQ